MTLSYPALRKHAYHLMSLASFGQVAVFMTWMIAAFSLSHGGGDLFVNARWNQWANEGNFKAFQVAVLVWMPVWLGQMWVLMQLRRLASSLYREDPLSLAVAGRFRALGNSVAVFLVLVMFGPAALSSALGFASAPVGVDFGDVLLGLIAFMILRTVTLMITQAVQVSDENRSFV